MNILVIDDHELFRDGIKLVLQKLDEVKEVYTVESGEKALVTIQGSIEFDIVLLDYNLPNCSGIDTLKLLKNDIPEVPIVMLSAEESPERIQETMQAGANGFITKSSSAEVMVSAVRLVLSGGMYLPPQLLFNNPKSTRQSNAQTTETPSSLPDPNQRNTPEVQESSTNSEHSLTGRQKQVLVQMSNGFSNKEIAKHLHMSPSTVKVHVSAIFRELGVGNRVQAIAKAKQHRLIDP
ncbi:response regulator transcription factor [Marinibactrum halimedae]|uniref:Glycerol metabolism activator n=1 Tax=Marinibactrum halimedae TaxID=1444977 RepID=A0AA37T899_9GAMM|nr:response regulator transcription factor [Marinibactrum halimedae]MCD9459649.1 response regulator transcription factor [Marinibactrum halimedae]GLS25676.1 glycerol metabolism activator [Marinibactrum halimedae]